MATTDLTRTPSSGGNRKTWTFSAWLKRAAKNDSNNSRILSAGDSTSDYTSWYMAAVNGTDGTLNFQNRISNTTTSLSLNRKFRDVNGWYHLVVACDTTQATASNRLKIYVNGVQETSFSTEQYPAQNADTFVNHTNEHNIGSADGAGYTPRYWAGSMAHVALVDGQQLTPTSFGETDSTTGIWKFKTPSGLSWGTNGFFLKFENSGNMGLDSSGQTNNFTVSGGTMTQLIDTPSNVFATLNALDNYYASATFSNGNLSITTDTTKYAPSYSTLGASSGKYYAECKMTSGSSARIGIISRLPQDTGATSSPGNDAYSVGYYSVSGVYYKSSNATSYGSTYTNGDIIGIAMDLDNNRLFFSKNGTWQDSGDPTSSTGAITIPTSYSGFYHFAVSDQHDTQNAGFTWNFGNGFFGTTAVSSAQNPDDGIGIFEYDVPAGYRALCTKSINAQEYS